MAEVIRMPRMSDTMTEGVFVEWHKKVGDEVASGDILAEVETDKATMDLESYQDGVLLYIGVEEGDAAPVDSIIAILGEEGEDYEELLKEEEAKQKDKEQDKEKEEEEEAKQEEERTAEAAPAAEKKAAPSPGPAPAVKQEEKVATQDGDGRIKASPLARKMAQERGIDLSRIQGSGDGGRITKRDVESWQPSEVQEVAQKVELPPVVGEESYEDVSVSQMRKTIARRLAESKFSAPHFYLTIDINMDRAVKSRESMNEVAPVKISFNDIIVKAAAAALRRHPQVNASWLGDRIRFNKHIHIGVAVAVDEGLIVPVIRFADNKSLSHISVETRELAEKARNKKLQPQEWEGNTFTISNLGMFGIEEFTAIINPPDSCILAIGSIREEAVVENGELGVGKRMKVTLSCDHRIVDGAVGSRFLQTFKEYMEDPARILI